jgi:hypothetical protein
MRPPTQRLMHATDIGVSYFLVGVIAVLSYRIPRPWRWGYLAVLIGVFAFLGLLCYPLTRSRPATSGSRSRS